MQFDKKYVFYSLHFISFLFHIGQNSIKTGIFLQQNNPKMPIRPIKTYKESTSFCIIKMVLVSKVHTKEP